MSDAAYESYKKACKSKGVKPSTRASLEKWDEEVTPTGTPFSELPDDARLIVTKRFLLELDAKIRKEVTQ